ncbi:MAG: protein kinase [Lachnospiraceae bacterium]|nr:protein kinase [Lachnospiraceae bacterium]
MNAGEILNNTYEIIEEIGSGGGGIVYKARHLRLETDVVVKKIKDEVIGRIESRQEADILKKLKHPYLPRVYDFIETENGVYTVMDFIQGEDLDTAVKHHGRYSQKQVRKWAEQLGEALSYLHGQNPPIIHSDIKPANIMLTKDDDVCLIDFNISLAMGGSMESAVGISAGFSPPEQYRDPALYARITHNYTLQKSIRNSGKMGGVEREDTPEKSCGRTDNRTEVLRMPESTDAGTDDKTEILRVQSDARGGADDKTEILRTSGSVNGEADNRTEILHVQDDVRNEADDRTEILSMPGVEERDEGDKPKALPRYTQYIGRGIDARSDIYSLGVTLYFLMTAMEPSADFDQRTSIEEADINISEGFALILDKMMELSPDERYQNGGAFLHAVRDCHKLDHRYILMHRKQRGMQVAALASLAAGIVLVFGGMYLMRKEDNARYYLFLQDAREAVKIYDYEEAAALLEEAKEISTARVDAYAEEAHLLYLSERYEECIGLCENYINTTPFLIETKEDEEVFADICYILGNAYIETDDYNNARIALAEALKYNDKNGLYYRDYAVALAKLGQIEEAERQLETGIGFGLAQDSIYMAQGELAHVKGQYENAVEYLEQTISVTDDMQMKKRAVLLCADVYKTMGGDAVDREIELLEQYVGQFEGNGGLVMKEYLAESYAKKALQDEGFADTYFQKALNLFTEIYEKGYITYQLQENIAILYENMDDFKEAERILTQMSEDYPQRYEVYKRLSMLEADKQQMKENEERDYGQMAVYYGKAKELYSGKEQDMEMDMLDNMIQDLEDGGWFH